MKCLSTKKRTVQARVERDLKMSTHLRSKKTVRNFSPSNCSFLFSGLFFVGVCKPKCSWREKRVSLIKLYTNTQSFPLNMLRAIVTFGNLVPKAFNRCLWLPLTPSNTSALYRSFLETLQFLQNPIFHSILVKFPIFQDGIFSI